MSETLIYVAIVGFTVLLVAGVAFVVLGRRAARLRMIAAFRVVAEQYGGRLVEPSMTQPEDFEVRGMEVGEVLVDMVVERPTVEARSGARVVAGPLRLHLSSESAGPDDVAIDLIPGGDAREHRLLVATGHKILDELCLVKSKDPEFATAWLGQTVCDVLVRAPWLAMEMKEGQVTAEYTGKEFPATAKELDELVRAVAAFAMGEENADVFFAQREHVGGYREASG